MPATASTTTEANRKQELALAERMNRVAEPYVEYWLKHGPDQQFGGFYGYLDRRGQPAAPTEKWLTQQSRHLWTFSTWYERREKSARIEAVARDLYKFIIAHFSDEAGVGFCRIVSRAGDVVDPVHQVYPQAFAVYALSTFGRVFNEPAAIERALACFKAFDQRVYEPRFGGYDLTNDPPWQTPGANKETNTHIHVMEALTALGEVSKNELLHQRLREFTELTITRHRQPLNYAHLEFLMDYTPLGEPRVSYGHDMETSWLVLEAMRVVNAQRVAEALAQSFANSALDMGKASAQWGFDTEKGGYFNAGIPAVRVLDHEKVWWVQFEALPALVRLHRAAVLPDALDRLERTLDWIEDGQRDKDFGGYYWGVLPDGTLGSYGDRKGDPWKASYHEMRGLMFAADWLAQSTYGRGST